MDLGLGNLTDLKTHLLNAALRSSTDYDAAIATLGRGVAAKFEAHCNRKFGRVVDDTFETGADKDFVSLPRYPVEEVSAIALRETLEAGWVDQGDVDQVLANINEAAGLLHFDAAPGGWKDRLKITFTGGYWYPTRGTTTLRRGSVVLTAGDESAAVEFSAAFGAAPAVVCNLLAPSGGVVISVAPSAATTAGFTALFGAPIPASGYTLSWLALATAYETPDESEVTQDVVALSADDESKAITFGAPFSAAPAVVCVVSAPSGGMIISATPSAVTASGFTALFGAPIPAAGYTLQWFALPASDDTTPDELPAGAAALPAHLKQAWLLQCQLVWNAQDALGIGLSGGAVQAAVVKGLSELTLAPDVAETLRTFHRYALT